MPSRIQPVTAETTDDEEVKAILEEARTGFWGDPNLFGMVAHRPAYLKAMVPVFKALFENGTIPPYLKDLMRVQTGYEWGCEY